MKCKEVENKKSVALIILTLVSWLCVSILSWKYFIVTVPKEHGALLYVFMQSLHIFWMLFWLWGIHNFWYQTLSFFRRKRFPLPPSNLSEEPVAILYTTCDDFDEAACLSCLNQDYSNMRLIICDDSRDESFQQRIDTWAAQYASRVKVVRRLHRNGFKAGNLNYVISYFVNEEFILLCDADEILPRDFISMMLPYFHNNSVAFVQAGHRARIRGQTRFAAILGCSIELLYKYSLPLRNRFGFVSCFGHGTIISRSVWDSIGGFPEIVSEDLGFASRALAAGFRGIYAEDVIAEEAFPSTYKAFVSKYCKIVSGTIEYFQKESLLLLKSPLVTLTEKADLLLTFSYCYICLVTIINLIGVIGMSYIYRLHGYNYLELRLFVLYLIGPLTPIVPLISNTLRNPSNYINYMVSAPIAYVSLIPVLTVKCIEQTLKLRKPTFGVTGKVSRQHQHLHEHALVIISGAFFISISILMHSSSVIPVAGISLMFLLGPLMCYSEKAGITGSLVRNCGIIPYGLMIFLFFLV